MNLKKNILIRELRNNARLPISCISRAQKIPVTTLYAVLRSLESGVIKKYVSILGSTKCFRKAILLVESNDNNQEIRTFLDSCPFVNNLYRTNKGFIAHIFFSERKEIERIKRRLRNQNAVFSMHPMEHVLAEEKFVPEQQYL